MRLPALTAALLVTLAGSLPVRAEPVEAPSSSTQTQATPAAPASPRPAPKLIVAISVDQLAADLFAQYRGRFTGGFARLLEGQVFPSGYQGHAATETCPGHSTILTGFRPARTGIIANNWIDQRVGRPDKVIYCSEDERAPGSTSSKYTVSAEHLRVPTLGTLMKRADARSRVVSVAGKDRAAVMMGGHQVDELWWWDGKTFTTYAGRAEPAVATRAKAATAALIARPQAALDLPAWCKPLAVPIQVAGQTFGTGRFERAAGDVRAFRASPALDAATLALAAGLAQDMKLGRSPAPDILAVGLSATDYIGHSRGTQGAEMCIQMAELDRALGGFLAVLDRTGVDYQLMLTADHGAHDMTERQLIRAMPMEAHIDPQVQAKAVGAAIGRDLGIAGPVLLGTEGDVYVDVALSARDKARVLAAAQRRYAALPQVAAAYTGAQIAATPLPTSPPETWTLLERARASYDAQRSGDLLVLLKPRVTTIEAPGPGYVATHGSPWDYDRRVPILFWRKGMPGFEQPLSVETIDIMPTLAAVIGLPVSGQDGRCLDLDPGAADTCKR